MQCLFSLCICFVWWIQRGRKFGKWIIDHIELSRCIKIWNKNQIWNSTHIIDRGSMCIYVCLLASVHCYYKCFRFTSFKLRCHFINLMVSNKWYPTNGSILQWKIEEDTWKKIEVGFTKSGGDCWHEKPKWFASWRFDEDWMKLFWTILKPLPLEWSLPWWSKGDLMIFMLIKARTCALHIVVLLRKCIWCL